MTLYSCPGRVFVAPENDRNARHGGGRLRALIPMPRTENRKSKIRSGGLETENFQHASPSGFTLVEILATVAILAIVMPATMYGLDLATRLAGLTRQRDVAINLAEARLNDLAVTGDWQNGPLSGTFTSAPHYSWQAATEAWPEPNLPNANLTELTVTVTWASFGRDRQVALSTLLYPTPPTTWSTGTGGPQG